MSAVLSLRPGATIVRQARLLRTAFVYEMRKVSAFRAGFLFREVLRGVDRSAVMIFVFAALYASSGRTTLRGYGLVEMVHYLLLVAVFQKLLFHERATDLADQIFEGTITKYMVMPVRTFTLVLGRWLQFTAVQLAVALVAFALGLLLGGPWWPRPAGPLAVAESLVLVLLGSYCFFLLYFTLNACAFWLDRVWTLLAMVRMTTGFTMGELVPVTLMPEALVSVFRYGFPYWALNGPIEVFTGRQGSGDFLFGLGVLGAWAVALQILAGVTWRRGLRHYGGVGA